MPLFILVHLIGDFLVFLGYSCEKSNDDVHDQHVGYKLRESVQLPIFKWLEFESENYWVEQEAHQVDQSLRQVPHHLVLVVRVDYVRSDSLLARQID